MQRRPLDPDCPRTWYHVFIALDDPAEWIKPVTVTRETQLFVYVEDGGRRPKQLLKVVEKSRVGEAFFPTREEAIQHVLRTLSVQAESFSLRHKQAHDRYKKAVAHYGSP